MMIIKFTSVYVTFAWLLMLMLMPMFGGIVNCELIYPAGTSNLLQQPYQFYNPPVYAFRYSYQQPAFYIPYTYSAVSSGIVSSALGDIDITTGTHELKHHHPDHKGTENDDDDDDDGEKKPQQSADLPPSALTLLTGTKFVAELEKPPTLITALRSPFVYTSRVVPLTDSKPTAVQFHQQDGLGQYYYGYANPHSVKHELQTIDGITRGSYSYIDANGVLQTVSYISDDINGFRVAATNLPKAPVPVEIPDSPEILLAKQEHFRAQKEALDRLNAANALENDAGSQP